MRSWLEWYRYLSFTQMLLDHIQTSRNNAIKAIENDFHSLKIQFLFFFEMFLLKRKGLKQTMISVSTSANGNRGKHSDSSLITNLGCGIKSQY